MVSPWEVLGPLKLYVHSISKGFGVALFSGEKVVSMYNSINPYSFQHSSTYEVERLTKALKAMKGFLIRR